jgi:hypothetical protein
VLVVVGDGKLMRCSADRIVLLKVKGVDPSTHPVMRELVSYSHDVLTRFCRLDSTLIVTPEIGNIGTDQELLYQDQRC